VVLGTTAEFLDVRSLSMAQGRFLPEDDWNRAQPLCVLGQKLREELFAATPAVGAWVRLGDRRFRVIGVLASSGVSIGTDLSEVAIIPVATAQALFNTPSLFRIMVEARSRASVAPAREAVRRIIRTRHEGEEDVTVITQDAVLATFDKILRALTLAVAGIAAISLGVAGILIMNVMLVAVSQRTAEIGLLKALGAPAHTVQVLFLSEATVLSLTGAGAGLAIGQFSGWLIGRVYPQVAGGAPGWAIGAALGVALVTGILFSLLPARRAARLDPVQALARR
jgi:putative ABC transport system permease protein